VVERDIDGTILYEKNGDKEKLVKDYSLKTRINYFRNGVRKKRI
jgi:hypothetical protein